MTGTKRDAPAARPARTRTESGPPAPDRGSLAVLVFHLAGQQYAIPLRETREIIPMAELARSPSLPGAVGGFLNVGGTAVVVVRLDRLFGLPDLSTGLYTPLVLLRDTSPPLALLVERVSRILHLPPDAVVPVRDDQSFNGAVAGLATVGGNVILLLSTERLLLDKEHQVLAEFQDREQLRLRALGETPS